MIKFLVEYGFNILMLVLVAVALYGVMMAHIKIDDLKNTIEQLQKK